jgi:hypothetical protein
MFTSFPVTCRNRLLQLAAIAILAPAAHAQTNTLPEVALVPDEVSPVRDEMRFGFSVATIGGMAVVGAPDTDGHGAAYIFTQSGGRWPQTQKLVAPDIAPGTFGSFVAIGMESLFVTDPVRQRVYVFQQLNGSPTWRATAILRGSAATPGYGRTMATEGCAAMITSTPNAGSHSVEPGYVHIYNRCPAVSGEVARWKYIRSITPAGSTGDDQFGASIAFHGREMLVGAPGEDGGKGAVYYYVYAGNNAWSLAQRIVEAAPRTDFGFGTAVDFHDSFAVIGLPEARRDEIFQRGGLVQTFQRSGQTWTQTGEMMPTVDQVTWAGYGAAVVVTADRVIIAAPEQFNAQVDLGGRVAIYKRTSGAPQLEEWLYGRDISSGFGTSLSVAGRGLAVGVPFSFHRPGNQEGEAFIYQLPP